MTFTVFFELLRLSWRSSLSWRLTSFVNNGKILFSNGSTDPLVLRNTPTYYKYNTGEPFISEFHGHKSACEGILDYPTKPKKIQPKSPGWQAGWNTFTQSTRRLKGTWRFFGWRYILRFFPLLWMRAYSFQAVERERTCSVYFDGFTVDLNSLKDPPSSPQGKWSVVFTWAKSIVELSTDTLPKIGLFPQYTGM